MFISSTAAKQISKILYDKSIEYFFRISIDGGGCAGFSYKFTIDKKNDDDIIFNNHGSRIIIDPMSMKFLKNAEIHFIDNIISKEFKIINPKIKSSCGCGMSFSI